MKRGSPGGDDTMGGAVAKLINNPEQLSILLDELWLRPTLTGADLSRLLHDERFALYKRGVSAFIHYLERHEVLSLIDEGTHYSNREWRINRSKSMNLPQVVAYRGKYLKRKASPRATAPHQVADSASEARDVAVAVEIGTLLQYQEDVRDHLRLLKEKYPYIFRLVLREFRTQ